MLLHVLYGCMRDIEMAAVLWEIAGAMYVVGSILQLSNELEFFVYDLVVSPNFDPVQVCVASNVSAVRYNFV
jgi:hypothetical protein